MIAVDLNPLSRTSQWAHVTIVDNVVRTMLLMCEFAEQFKSLTKEMPLIRNVTTVIGTHVGIKGVGFVAVRGS